MIGDLFAWRSRAGLVVLIGVALAPSKADEAGAAAPRGEPLTFPEKSSTTPRV